VGLAIGSLVSSKGPARNGKVKAALSPSRAEKDGPVMPRSRSVLVVDDDPDVLEVLAAMLEDLGCDVIRAANGPDALDHLRRNEEISILITDINMPGMDGHELAHLATRIRPELKVLQLSGREPRRGGYPMIRKPFTEEDLANTMQKTTGLC
jgi:two-component system, cell cycle response regulator CpdR